MGGSYTFISPPKKFYSKPLTINVTSTVVSLTKWSIQDSFSEIETKTQKPKKKKRKITQNLKWKWQVAVVAPLLLLPPPSPPCCCWWPSAEQCRLTGRLRHTSRYPHRHRLRRRRTAWRWCWGWQTASVTCKKGATRRSQTKHVAQSWRAWWTTTRCASATCWLTPTTSASKSTPTELSNSLLSAKLSPPLLACARVSPRLLLSCFFDFVLF